LGKLFIYNKIKFSFIIFLLILFSFGIINVNQSTVFAQQITVFPNISAVTIVTLPGFVDVIPRQIVRAKNDKLYFISGKAESVNSIRIYGSQNSGLPMASSDFIQLNEILTASNPLSVEAAYDGNNFIHILVNSQDGFLKDYPFDITNTVFKATKTIVSGSPNLSTGSYIGTSGVSAMFDKSGRLNIAYWSAGKHVSYRAYSYDSINDTLTNVFGPIQIDTAGSANHPSLAISPFDSSITVSWISEATSPAKILARTATNTGLIGSVESVSTTDVWTSTNSGVNIDQGPSLVIDTKGTKHLTYIKNFDSTGDYGRIHYVVNSGSGWVDTELSSYTHDPALAIDSVNNLYIIGHGSPQSPECKISTIICVKKKNTDNTWSPSAVLASPTGMDSYDASASVKWGVIGWNRPETVEFLFFRANSGSYYNTTVMYSRLENANIAPTPTAIVTTTTGTPTTAISTTATTTSSTTTCINRDLGDVNCDGKIDLGDFEIGRKEWAAGLVTKTADLNHDGIVDYSDFTIWRMNFK